MPHSGIVLVSRLLAGIGLDLGPTSEELPTPNGGGRFTRLNDEILRAADAAWNSPPPRDGGWLHSSQLEPVRRTALDLPGLLGLSEPWGWADPRNSLTLPFWQELFPDLGLIVCVRDPRDVIASLHADAVISARGALNLWEEYYRALLDLAGDACVITHYDSYREDPKAELERVARGLGLDSSRVATTWTAASLELPRTAVEGANGRLPVRVQDLYERLREAAKAPAPEARPAKRSPAVRVDLPKALEAQRGELEHLRLELAGARGHIDALRTQVEVRSLEPSDLRDVIRNLEQQLVERDEQVEKLHTALLESHASRREAEAALTRGIEDLERELEFIKSTRLWSAWKRYWAVKARLRRLFRRGP